MSKPLNILIVEDSEDDALLLLRELRRGGYGPVSERVETREDMKAALDRRQWDIIISDYMMPKFSGLAALEVLKESGADLPFIIVSGNIGEDIAVEAMKAGAHDYIIKGKLTRLVPAVDRELREAADRSERKRTEEAFRIEQTFRRTIEDSILVGIAAVDLSGRLFYVNQALCDMTGWSRQELEGTAPPYAYWPPESVDDITRLQDMAAGGMILKGGHEIRLMRKGGERFDTLCFVSPLLDTEGKPSAWLSTYHDITERKKAARRTEVTSALLKLFTQKFTRKEYLDAACGVLRTWTGCHHAGIRIADRNHNIPFESSEGYDEAFLHEERTLSLVKDQCICTRVITGTPVAPDLCAMTTEGSFYSNDTDGFAGALTSVERQRYKDVCMRMGYRSLAVIPIRYRENPLGAIHIADERPDVLPRESVEFLEQLAFIIGEAIFRFGIEEELRNNYDDLQKTTELLERIFSTTHMLVAYLDRDFNFIRVNRAYATDGERSPEFYPGKNLFTLCPDDEMREIFQNVVKTGEPHFVFESPFKYNFKDERRHMYWDWSLLPVREADGKIVGLLFTLLDVTARKKAEEELRRANAYNRSLIEASLDPLVTIGPDGKITDVNAATEAATGRSRQDLIGTDFSEYFTEPDRARAGYLKVFREGSIRDYALDIRRGDGCATPALYNASVYRDENGHVRGVFAVARDVTELKKAEKDRARLASAVESTADGVVITDPKTGEIQYVNAAFEQITGYTKEEVIGRTLHILDSGRHDEEFYRVLRETLRREGVWRGRLINRKKDGTLYFEDSTFSPVRDETGAIINYISVKRDITEKLRLESIAESVNTMDNIGYVFSGVRHEIGNPINSAKMSLSVLQHKLDSASKSAIRDYVDRALGEIGRVEQLLKNLRNYNLYEKPELEVLNLKDFLGKFLHLVTEDFAKKGIAIKHEYKADSHQVVVDPRALQQVLLNLLTNSADALSGRSDPVIDISMSKKSGRVLLRVADNGCGMTEKQQQDMFKPFYTSKPHGTGLGLVIVKKMLTRMNGNIEITSSLNRGTTVTIYLPEGDSGRSS
ncbi:MAG TPA: PAS domain S-box protein [Nitrospirota bacterium]|nr:PAS domain S-box protein [Nitrospirota bacterium]